MKQVIETRIVNDAAELKTFLDYLGDREVIYTQNAEGEPVRVSLGEDTLSDGSKVLNLEVR